MIIKNSIIIVDINAPFRPIQVNKQYIIIMLTMVEKIVILIYSRLLSNANINCFNANETPIKTGIINPILKKEINFVTSSGLTLKNNKITFELK